MKMNKTNHGTIHRVANCEHCEWNDAYGGRGDSIERVARSARAHAKKTGHSVNIESATSFTYHGN